MDTPESPDPRAARARRADALYTLRRARAAALPDAAGLFGEPAWDILLDLYVAQASGRTVSVSDACVAAAVPHSTALRYIDRLAQAGTIRRTADPGDARRAFVTLSDSARAAMDRLFAEPDAARAATRRSDAGKAAA